MRERLVELQRALERLYRLPPGEDVRGFVCDAETTTALAGSETVGRGEALLVLEDGAGCFVGLYLDEGALERAREPAAWLSVAGAFEPSCLVAEGVSHFVMVQYRSAQEIPVSELELELQAEVDKWALGVLGGRSMHPLEGFGVGLVRERSRLMRRRLFGGAQLRDDAASEKGQRYERAIRLAHRYTDRLERAHVRRGDLEGLASELRCFYRLASEQKLAHAAR
jgi:hypothetical protein